MFFNGGRRGEGAGVDGCAGVVRDVRAGGKVVSGGVGTGTGDGGGGDGGGEDEDEEGGFCCGRGGGMHNWLGGVGGGVGLGGMGLKFKIRPQMDDVGRYPLGIYWAQKTSFYLKYQSIAN